MCTPAAAKSGRPAGKRSSTIHCVNGSVTTGHASVMPSAEEISDRSSSEVSGTIRSTMVDGKATSASIHVARAGDRQAARAGGDETADGRARRARVLQVMNDVGMLFVEIAGLRRVTIALLGHRQRDDARSRARQPRDQLLRTLGRE